MSRTSPKVVRYKLNSTLLNRISLPNLDIIRRLQVAPCHSGELASFGFYADRMRELLRGLTSIEIVPSRSSMDLAQLAAMLRSPKCFELFYAHLERILGDAETWEKTTRIRMATK